MSQVISERIKFSLFHPPYETSSWLFMTLPTMTYRWVWNILNFPLRSHSPSLQKVNKCIDKFKNKLSPFFHSTLSHFIQPPPQHTPYMTVARRRRRSRWKNGKSAEKQKKMYVYKIKYNSKYISLTFNYYFYELPLASVTRLMNKTLDFTAAIFRTFHEIYWGSG